MDRGCAFPPGMLIFRFSKCYFVPRHVLEDCPSVANTRMALGIKAFLDGCLKAGRSRETAYKSYIIGLDENGCKVDVVDHLQRGACLRMLTEAWLRVWEDPENM